MSTPEGLADPGPLPTTLTRPVINDETTDLHVGPRPEQVRAMRYRFEQLRTAVIAANELAKMVGEAGSTDGVMEAARRWRLDFGALADPPLKVEVEADDEDDSHEDALSVREEERVTSVFLRTDGTLEHQIGTINAPEGLPVLLHLVADEMQNATRPTS